MKRLNVVRIPSLIITIALLILNTVACAKAEFALNSLNITPEKVAAGDPAVVTINISNVGKSDGTYHANLTINRETAETRDIKIPVGLTETANFTVTRQVVGNYEVAVGELTGNLIVAKPPEFQLSSLDIKPTEVVLGSEVSATVNVHNIGEVDGNFEGVILVNGIKNQTRKTVVHAGETVTVSFSFTAEKAGSYPVAIGELSKTIKVLKPAEFQLTDLKISPVKVSARQLVMISFSIRNIGEVAGSYKSRLTIDRTIVDIKDLTVNPGDTQTTQFEYAPPAAGSYKVTVGGLKVISGSNNLTPAYEVVTAGELSSTLTVLKRTVLVDASKDGGSWWSPQVPPFDQEKDHQGKNIADYLRSLGYEVTEYPRGYQVSLDLLRQYDFVIREGVYLRSQSYTPNEINAYQDYVKNGGKVLLLTPGLRTFERDPLSESFGLVFAGTTRGIWARPKLADHPIFNGNLTPILNLGGSGLISYPPEAKILGWVAESEFLDTNDNQLKDGQEMWAPPALGEMDYGKGKIVFEGQFAAAESLGFIGNVINWFASIVEQ